MYLDPLLNFAQKYSSENSDILGALREVEYDDARQCEIVRSAALSGSAFAMCVYSRFLRKGFGCQRSDVTAFSWAESAANLNFPPAFYQLGEYFEEGVAVPVSISRAIDFYKKSASSGYGFAAFKLFLLLKSYESDKFGITESLEYLEMGARLGESVAAHELAKCYELGEGLIQNNYVSVHWYKVASDLGSFFASSRLSAAYMLGELGLKKNKKLEEMYRQRTFDQMRNIL